MFELEDYSTGGFHDGFLNKYADSSGPTLDFYISDSLQDMLDIDIRSEIATVVGGSNELASLVSDLPSSFDHAIDAISAINNSSSISSSSNSLLHSSAWLGATSGPTWSSSNDFYADVGACVNPISVMPLISSSMLHQSPKTNLNVNGLRSSATSPPPPSPTETKSHLTFSPAQIKISSSAMRKDMLMKTNASNTTTTTSNIPKQIVSISSTVTSATTAPATMATNSLLQRKNMAALDAIKKDLSSEMSKTVSGTISGDDGKHLIKLAPGIGGLTFANSITYNKLKQQSAAKSANGSPLTSNGTIVLKRDRDSSPLHNMTTLNPNGSVSVNSITNGYHHNAGQHVTKILARNVIHTSAGLTPKSIASAQSPLLQQSVLNNGGMGSSSISSNSSSSSSIGSPSSSSNGSHFGAGLTPITTTTTAAQRQKVKLVAIESEYPKPAYSYSCLIALALKNSRSGSLPVSEIYSFMCEHFPYFKTAPSGWKNSVRHNLSLNKCFEKIEKPATNGNQRKGCLWAMNPERIAKMDEEVQKWSRKDPLAIRNAMVFPEHLESLERGEMKHGSASDSDVELDSQSEIEETSDSEQDHELDETIVENMFVKEEIEEEDDLSMLSNGGGGGMLVVNGSDMNDVVIGASVEDDEVGLAQQHRDFDIEVEDIYDAIDMEDDKEAVRMAISQSDIIEMGTADIINAQNATMTGYQSPKRARLNVNYSIRPAGGNVALGGVDLQQPQTFKAIKVQPLQQHHIVVQTLNNNNRRGSSPQTIQSAAGNTSSHQLQSSSSSQQPHFQQITAIPNHNRRKMQLVNRIA